VLSNVVSDSFIYKNSRGDIFHYSDETKTILHREDGPACIFHDGYEAWYLNGKRHCETGPARQWKNGSSFRDEYYLHGERFSKLEFMSMMCDKITLTKQDIADLLQIDESKLEIV